MNVLKPAQVPISNIFGVLLLQINITSFLRNSKSASKDPPLTVVLFLNNFEFEYLLISSGIFYPLFKGYFYYIYRVVTRELVDYQIGDQYKISRSGGKNELRRRIRHVIGRYNRN